MEPLVKPKKYPEIEVMFPPGISRNDAAKLVSRALREAGIEQKQINRYQVESIKALGYIAAMRVAMEWVTVKT